MHPVLLIVILIIFFLFRHILLPLIPLRLPSTRFKYVYVENDGSVRELDEEEQNYLLEEFHPNDGGRPYIKSNYWELTPDKKIHGFIKRSLVPWWIAIKSNKRV